MNRNVLIAIGLVVAIALGVLVGVVAGSGGDDKGEPVAREVQLEPISSTTPNPFMAAVGTDAPNVTPPAEISSGTAPQTFQGSLPGLYGGTRNTAACDPDAMVRFLEANPDRAQAWVSVIGIRVSEIATYASELTPLILRADTAVTNHGFADGRPTVIPAVLQAGTAVLVDKYGVPRVKCDCGNPLSPPRYPSDPVYRGDRWSGFQPGGVVIVDRSVTVINVITVIDIETNQPFGRPVGSTGSEDGEAPETPSGSSTTSTSPTSSTTQPDSGSGRASEAVATVRQALDDCVTTSGDFGDFFTPEEFRQVLDSIRYEATSVQGDVVTVKLTGPEGDFATWTVNTRTGDITPADPVAAELGQYCPTLA